MQPFNAERGESGHNKTDSKDNKSGGTDTKGASSVWNKQVQREENDNAQI